MTIPYMFTCVVFEFVASCIPTCVVFAFIEFFSHCVVLGRYGNCMVEVNVSLQFTYLHILTYTVVLFFFFFF